MERTVMIASAVFLVLMVIGAVLRERSNVVEYFRQVGAAALAFNLASMAIGYVVPLVLRLPRRQATAISLEIGVHNGTLAIAVASSPMLLNNTTMAIPPAIYSLIMLFTAAGFGWFAARQNDAAV